MLSESAFVKVQQLTFASAVIGQNRMPRVRECKGEFGIDQQDEFHDGLTLHACRPSPTLMVCSCQGTANTIPMAGCNPRPIVRATFVLGLYLCALPRILIAFLLQDHQHRLL